MTLCNGPVICWTIAHACLVDLQALLVTASLKGDGPANNCHFRMILKIILKKEKPEAPSLKQQATLDNGSGIV
jgi:hypothetical protein